MPWITGISEISRHDKHPFSWDIPSDSHYLPLDSIQISINLMAFLTLKFAKNTENSADTISSIDETFVFSSILGIL